MGTLIYSNHQIAPTPYYLEEVSVNVYTLEELSYIILNNVYLLNADFMSVDLCNWIGRELKDKKLCDELLDLIKTNVQLHIFVGHLLTACGYSSKKEIKDVLTIISTFENKSEAERKKMRADRLMENEKYVDAIYEYEQLTTDDYRREVSRQLLGDVFHNLGCAYAKLFLFNEACRAFDEAYRMNTNRNSLYCLLYAYKCKRDNLGFDEAVKKYQVGPDEIKNVLGRISDATLSKEILDFDSAINTMGEKYLKTDDYHNSLSMIIGQWKNDYYKHCRI